MEKMVWLCWGREWQRRGGGGAAPGSEQNSGKKDASVKNVWPSTSCWFTQLLLCL